MSNSETADYSSFSASLRIVGDIPDLDAVSRELGIVPTHTHRRGDRRGPKAPPFDNDAWIFTAAVEEERPLDDHLMELWRLIKPRASYLKTLKRRYAVDVFCGYRSNSDTAGFSVSPAALAIFTELDVPFGISVVIT